MTRVCMRACVHACMCASFIFSSPIPQTQHSDKGEVAGTLYAGMASVAASVGSSYLTNCVEGIYGHAAARAVANDLELVNATLAAGFKV